MLTSEQFERTRRLALNLAGIELHERHREVLARRHRRLGIMDSTALDRLLGRVEAGHTEATQQFLCLLTTKFTGFFRHPLHFQKAAEHAFRAARARGIALCWSAGAATGEEPYSLAVALLEAFGCERPPAHILATDVDVNALAAAQRGEYGELALRAVTPARREAFFVEVVPGRRWRIRPVVRQMVDFQQLNLVDSSWPQNKVFDVILCRNVLMYLGAQHRRTVLERMALLLAPDGFLMMDPAENLGKAGDLFTGCADGVYSLRRSDGPSGAARIPPCLQPKETYL